MTTSQLAEIRIEGKTFHVPSTHIEGRRLIVTGRMLKFASVHDEELWDGDAIQDPEPFFTRLTEAPDSADIFTFAQQPGQTQTPFAHHCEFDNAAAIPLQDYAAWWNALPQVTRRNVRTAAKRGLEVRVVQLDDEFVRGVSSIYNETPVRQGRHFWHYGKSLSNVKHELSTYLERSAFIGAFHDGKLFGFIKLVYANRCAHILHILSREAENEKRPTNALINKAVEIATAGKLAYLFYCKYVYGRNDRSPLIDFKRHNGFIHLPYPRYYVPLTFRGKLALSLRLHHGPTHLLPVGFLNTGRRIRRRIYKLRARSSPSEVGPE
jgi:hypothetical protein